MMRLLTYVSSFSRKLIVRRSGLVMHGFKLVVD